MRLTGNAKTQPAIKAALPRLPDTYRVPGGIWHKRALRADGKWVYEFLQLPPAFKAALP